MSVLYFDCFSGISGDMTLGALLDLGIDEGEFRRKLAGLAVSGYDLAVTRRSLQGIHGTAACVTLRREGHGHGHGETNLRSLEKLIEESALPRGVKDTSLGIFREIARAEGAVHHQAMEDVHFHEVGAVDSLVDIVGTAICIDMLDVEGVLASPLHDGTGFVECRHGTIPVPVPAVMEMLKGSGIPLVQEDIPTELVTPTGMGIIKRLSSGFGVMPPMTIEAVGYGFGTRRTGRLNALRVVMGSPLGAAAEADEVAVLETNIDDSTPEMLGYAMERLLESGAPDVFYTPVHMKKNRPAAMLTVLCAKRDEEKLATIIFEETSTLGVRTATARRLCMKRTPAVVETEYGPVRVKVATRGGLTKVSPEFEDARALARAAGVPLARLYHAVQKGAPAAEGTDETGS